MNLLFKDIRVINPSQNLDEVTNIWIKNGIISSISKNLPNIDNDTEIINSENFICSPGFYDMHVHFREPGYEYKEDMNSGASSAANGGFTGVLCMPNTNPAIDNPSVVELIKSKTRDLLVDVHVSGALTQNRAGKHLSPMLELNDSGVKMFTDDGTCVMDSEVIRRAFNYASGKDLLISQHCEDHTLTEGFSANDGYNSGKLGLKGYPAVAEEIMLSRDLMLAEYYGNRRYHASHISTEGAVRLIRDAKKRGMNVSCEVTPHHFTLDDGELVKYDTNYKMNPPLRTNKDIAALIEGLGDGTIDCIATDHAPHALHEKYVEFDRAPFGIIGLETALGLSITYLVQTGVLSLGQLIEKLSVNPRKILKLPDIKISENEIANLTIFDPEESWKVNKTKFKSKSKNTPYNDCNLKGKPKFTINNFKLWKCDL